MEANLNLDSSKLFFTRIQIKIWLFFLVAKQAYTIDNEQGKLNRAESYKATYKLISTSYKYMILIRKVV